jgi:group I intron endonuclease
VEPYGEVYIIVNQVNNKVYIGQTIRTLHERWLAHCRRAKAGGTNCAYFYNAIRKYGEGSFKAYRINVAFSKEELDTLEVSYIEKFKACDPEYGYNSTLGGGGVVANEATRQKFKEANKGERNPMFGKHCSEQTRQRMSASQRGHSVPESTRKAVAESNRRRAGKPQAPHKSGWKHSDTSKQKMREALKGRTSAWNKGKKMPEGFGEKIAKAKRGKPRPVHVIAALREANRKRPPVRWLCKDGVAIKIAASEVINRLCDGWRLGRK